MTRADVAALADILAPTLAPIIERLSDTITATNAIVARVQELEARAGMATKAAPDTEPTPPQIWGDVHPAGDERRFASVPDAEAFARALRQRLPVLDAIDELVASRPSTQADDA